MRDQCDDLQQREADAEYADHAAEPTPAAGDEEDNEEHAKEGDGAEVDAERERRVGADHRADRVAADGHEHDSEDDAGGGNRLAGLRRAHPRASVPLVTAVL